MKFKILIVFVLSFVLTHCNQVTAKNEEIKTEVKKDPKPTQKTIKVALLLDTSNSMDGLINQAKAQLWEVVNELSYAKCDGNTPNLKIALYQYGNDELSYSSGYIKQMIGFTDDLDDISEKLFGLTTNGGEEYCGAVINSSVKELEWGDNKSDLKMIFIAGNEPFTQGNVNFKDAIGMAKENDISINTIFCGSYHQGISGNWKTGADLGNGDYMNIDHNKQLVHIKTPYDQDIMSLNKKLNKTYVYYGNKGAAKYKKQTEQDENAMILDDAIATKRAITKSSKLYKNSSWDLIDAVEEEIMEVEEIVAEKLPAELQNKSEEDLKTIVAQKSKERKAIQKQIQELSQKRDKFVAEKQPKQNNELENALIKAIKTQAKNKNYTW